jgi:branched-chain amino acid transport system ATP-binding protein
MSICERIIVINEGKLIAEGSSEEIQNNSEVARVYLGERAAANVVEA